MKKFGDDFFERVKKLIDQDQNSKNLQLPNSPEDVRLYEEVLTHASFCNQIALKFRFREELIEKVCKLRRKNIL